MSTVYDVRRSHVRFRLRATQFQDPICACDSESLDGNALCQIARLVDVATHGEGGVVRQELEWDTQKDRLQLGFSCRDSKRHVHPRCRCS